MDARVKEDGVLEVRALTMTKRVLDQLRIVKPDEVEEFIGWSDMVGEWYIGKSKSDQLVRVRRMDMWERFGPNEENREKFNEEAEKLGIGPARLANMKLDEWRESLPQIFIK